MKAKNTKDAANPKKGKGCLTTIIVIIIALGLLVACFGEVEDPAETTTETTIESQKISNNSGKTITTETTTEATTESALEPYSKKLSAGFYTAGIDFPAGTYNITAISGTGNAISSNMFSGGLNEIMSSQPDEYSSKEFKNAKLEDGTTLSISSTLTVKITTKEADKNSISKRKNSAKKSIELSSGHYTAGTDFPVGVYDIETISGNGNVYSSNMFDGGLNEIFGAGNDGFSINKFKNAQFDEGIDVDVSGVTIKLTPSK